MDQIVADDTTPLKSNRVSHNSLMRGLMIELYKSYSNVYNSISHRSMTASKVAGPFYQIRTSFRIPSRRPEYRHIETLGACALCMTMSIPDSRVASRDAILLMDRMLCVHLHIVGFLQKGYQPKIEALCSGGRTFKWRANVNFHET